MVARVPLPTELDIQLKAHFDRTVAHFDRLGKEGAAGDRAGGGYGRGEGGIATGPDGGARFFNDLDYFIFTETPDDPDILESLRDWEREESVATGIDVEGKCLPKSDLRQTPGSMMFYDLVTAQTIVAGPRGLF